MVTKMNTKKSPGRPPKAAAQSRRQQVAFRVTDTAMKAIETAAAANHLSVGAYARFCALADKDALRPTTPAKMRAAVDAEAVAELNRLGIAMSRILLEMRHGRSYEADLREAIVEVREAIVELAGSD